MKLNVFSRRQCAELYYHVREEVAGLYGVTTLSHKTQLAFVVFGTPEAVSRLTILFPVN